jgi:hypothetical protein
MPGFLENDGPGVKVRPQFRQRYTRTASGFLARPLSQRGSVAMDRARADAGALAGTQIRFKSGVFAADLCE